MGIAKNLLITVLGLSSIYFATAQQCDTSGSLVPNHDFNNYSQLPDNMGQMDRALNWFQVTNGTSDYYYDPDFLPGYLGTIIPSPNGSGFVGFYTVFDPTYMDYFEYVGNILNSPLLVGENYTFKFEIGSLLAPLYDASTYTMDLVFYGIEIDSGSYPLGISNDIITSQGVGAEEIARISIDFSVPGEWRDVSITLSPTKNYEVLAIGGDNIVATDGSGTSSSYTLLDNLRLDRADCFAPPTTTKVQKIPTNNWFGLILLIASLLAIFAYRQFKIKN